MFKTTMRRHRTLCATLAALFSVTAAHAARPLVSETADANAAGTCELESALTRDTARGTPAARAWQTVLACGVDHDTQIGATYSLERSAGQTAQAYVATGKTALVAPQPGRTGWGIAYSLGALKAPGLNLRLEEIRLIGVATREVAGGLLVHANLGWSHSRSERRNRTQWSLGVEMTSDLTVAADVFGDDRSRTSISAGIGYAFGGSFSANLSYALRFENPRIKSLGLGAKFVF